MASPSGSSVTLEALGPASGTSLSASRARDKASSSVDIDHKSGNPAEKKPRTKRRKRSNSNESTVGTDQDGTSRKESLSGALARSLVGTLAFVFRAPVRLFRPVKLSSWSLLETMAKREGRSLSLRYLRTLLRREKRSFLPHLLLPPLLVNTTIGFCLFEAYSLTESRLLGEYYPLTEVEEQGTSTKKNTAPAFTPLWIVAIAGGAAGTAQCIVSAPLDNVRIILSSDIGKVGGRHHRGSSNGRGRLAAHPLGISWRAVARAAILPFAPAVTRDRLVEQVRKSSAAAAKTSTSSIWRSLLGLAGRNVSAQEAEQTRQVWEKRLERWRGGVHGAGLIMSLARDSVGFAAFFLAFECSRRIAFKASQATDRALAFFNASATLPLGIASASPGSRSSSEIHTESSSKEERQQASGDVSYSQSRTRTGRFVAAFVLIVGGAVGAAMYELVGRPAELARVVVWEGRKAWEEGRRGKPKSKAKLHKSRAVVSDTAATKGRSVVRGARVPSAERQSMRLSTFMELRRANTLGIGHGRVMSLAANDRTRPPHPLRRKVPSSEVKTKVKSAAPKKAVLGPVVGGQRGRQRRKALYAASSRAPPPLSTRPSAYTLLLEHAQRTSILRHTSKNPGAPLTPVPAPVLLLHTYFIAPFITRSSADAAVSPRSATLRPESRLRKIWTLRNPVSAGPGSLKSVSSAQSWGSGRVAWALRRLATPYGLGFLTYAWMSGDI